MTRRCTTSCTPEKHTPACLFATLIETPPARPVRSEEWDWALPFNVVEHPGMPPGLVLVGTGWEGHVVAIRLDEPAK